MANITSYEEKKKLRFRNRTMPLTIADERRWEAGDQEAYQVEQCFGETEKNEFLGNALAVLLPIDWPEPFGLMMIEAMACGTPTIAYRHGSVSEVLEDKKTGFIVDNPQDAVRAVNRIPLLSRRTCREVFERRFNATRMAHDYLGIYQAVLSEQKDIAAARIVRA
jgi:glycosyltransferase involved in cell wall biosynthesis